MPRQARHVRLDLVLVDSYTLLAIPPNLVISTPLFTTYR